MTENENENKQKKTINFENENISVLNSLMQLIKVD